MIIVRKSPFTGKVNSMDLPVTDEQLAAYYDKGVLLQNAFPNLDAGQREFIKTGITSAEWDAMFNKDEDEDEDLLCEVCGAKLTGEEGMMICFCCQEESCNAEVDF